MRVRLCRRWSRHLEVTRSSSDVSARVKNRHTTPSGREEEEGGRRRSTGCSRYTSYRRWSCIGRASSGVPLQQQCAGQGTRAPGRRLRAWLSWRTCSQSTCDMKPERVVCLVYFTRHKNKYELLSIVFTTKGVISSRLEITPFERKTIIASLLDYRDTPQNGLSSSRNSKNIVLR